MYLKSAFFISLVTYLLLILAEAIQPGFVSNYFSAHWLLLVALGLFILLVVRGETFRSHRMVEWVLAILVALIFGVVTWRLGEPLEELRFLMVLVAAMLPFGILSLSKQ